MRRVAFESGAPLTYGQLTNLQDGEVVWIRYRKDGTVGFRLDQLVTVQADGEGEWIFNDVDGAGIVADMTLQSEASYTSPAVQYCRS